MTNPATVVAITSAAPTRFMISIYDVQASSSTPTGGNNGTSTGPSSAAVTVNSNGVALADGCQQTPGTGPTMTGGGVTVDDTYLNTNALLGGHTTTAGSDTITTTVGSGGGLNTALSLAAWPHD